VTTIRVEEARHVKLKQLGHNHEDMVLYLNNSQNNIPFVSQGENGCVQYPSSLFWDHGRCDSFGNVLRLISEAGFRLKY
jgi:hypothetical protein